MVRNAMSLLVAAVILVAPAAFAQHQHEQPPAAAPQAQDTAMAGMDCQAMMHEMHASGKAMDDRLQQLVAEMNRASGSARVDRMAAVINELVTQRTQMREQMMQMMPRMMNHMMQHMQSGMASSMMACPMMKHGAADKTPPAEHRH
jgi:hypothetical protein